MTIPTRDTIRSGISHAREKRDGIIQSVISDLPNFPKVGVAIGFLTATFALTIGGLRLIPGFGWLLLLGYPALAFLIIKLAAFWLGTQMRGKVAWTWAIFRERMADHQLGKLITVAALVILSTGFNLYDGTVAQEHIGADLAFVARWVAVLTVAALPFIYGALRATETLARHYESDSAAPAPQISAEDEAPRRQPRMLRKPPDWDAD